MGSPPAAKFNKGKDERAAPDLKIPAFSNNGTLIYG
jgi:hypothetical protein